MNVENMGSYMLVFNIEGNAQLFAGKFIDTLRYYKEKGELAHAEISRFRDVIVLEVSCTKELYNRMSDFVYRNFYVIMEWKMPHPKSMIISHITKEEIKNKAKEYAQKSKEGAVKAGKFAYEHREQIAKGAKVAAEVAPLLLV